MTAALSFAAFEADLDLLEDPTEPLDRLPWCETHLWIHTKAGTVVPLRFKPVQLRILEAIERLEAEGKPVRIIVLKARQQGVSTLTEALIYERVRRRSWQSATIIGNETENSDHLFGMFKLFNDRDPDAPEKVKSNAKKLEFKSPHGSQVIVTTAKKAHAGTGHTNQAAHISELAKWDRAETTMLSLMQTVPDGADTLAIVESTANGATGYFPTLWHDAEAGRNAWTPIFLAWFEDPEYRMPVGSYSLSSLGSNPRYNLHPTSDAGPGDELILREQGIDDEQLTWRRWAIDNKCGGDLLLFRQEYPATPREAFLASGSPRFNMVILDRWEQACTEPAQRGTYDARRQWVEGEDAAFVSIWNAAEADETYVIGADCSEGNEGLDYSSAGCLGRRSRRQVATIHGHLGEVEADAYAHLLMCLGYEYNTALIVIEVNAYGLAVAEALLKAQYPNLYFRTVAGEDKDAPPSRKVGWKTSPATKPLLTSDLAEAIRDDSLDVPCVETVRELQGFRRLGNGKEGSDPSDKNAHDDRAIHLGLCVQGLQQEDSAPLHNFSRKRHIRKVVR